MNTTSTEAPHYCTPGETLSQIGEWRDKDVPAWGHTAVDFERRVDHDRLRRYRWLGARSKDALQSVATRARYC